MPFKSIPSSPPPSFGSKSNTTSCTSLSSSMVNEGTSSELQFRQALHTHFVQSGLQREILTSLRSKVIHQLLSTTTTTTATTHKNYTSTSLEYKLVNALVTQFLDCHQFEYTLSVYLPESGQAHPTRMSEKEFIELMHLDYSENWKPFFHRNEHSASKHTSLLETLILGVRSLNKLKLSQQVQTEEWEWKISTTSNQNLSSSSSSSLDSQAIYVQACNDMQQKYELFMEDKIQQEVEKRTRLFCSTESKRIYLEAKESYLFQFEKIKKELELYYEKKLHEEAQKYIQLESQWKKKEKEWERQLLEKERHRFQDMETWQTKWKQLQHQHELELQENKTHLFQLQREKEEALVQYHKKELEFNELLDKQETQLQKARLECSREQSEWLHRVKLQEAKLEAELLVVNAKKESLDRYLKEESALRHEVAELRSQFHLSLRQALQQTQRSSVPAQVSSASSETNLHSSITSSSSASLYDKDPLITKWKKEMRRLKQKYEEKAIKCADLENQLSNAKKQNHYLQKEVDQLNVLLHQLSFPSSKFVSRSNSSLKNFQFNELTNTKKEKV